MGSLLIPQCDLHPYHLQRMGLRIPILGKENGFFTIPQCDSHPYHLQRMGLRIPILDICGKREWVLY